MVVALSRSLMITLSFALVFGILSASFPIHTSLATVAPSLSGTMVATSPVRVGDPITVNFTVSNNGQTTATNVIPSNLTLTSTSTDHVVANISVPYSPYTLAYNPANGNMYVAYRFSDVVSVLSSSSNTVLQNITFPSGSQPFALAYCPLNHMVYVAKAGTDQLSIINSTTNSIVGTVTVGVSPEALAYDSNNNELYVANYGGLNGTISAVDVSTNTVVATINVGFEPQSLAFDRTNKEIFVGDPSEPYITVISDSTNTVLKNMDINAGNVTSVTFNPSNNLTYVTEPYLNNVALIVDGKTNTIVGNVSVGSFPSAAAYNPNNRELYITNQFANSVSIVSSNSSVVGVVDLASSPPPYLSPFAIAFDGSNGNMYVANLGLNSLSVIGSNSDIATCPTTPISADIVNGSSHSFVYTCSTTSPGTLVFTANATSGGATTGTVQSNQVTINSGTPPPTVTVIKRIVGGTATLANFTFTLNGQAVTNGTANSVTAGVQQYITESFNPFSLAQHYDTTYSGDCDTSGNINATKVTPGAVLQCVVTNVFIGHQELPGRIAFLSNRDGNDQIYAINPDGTNETRLTNNNANDENPSWSPDGTKIAFDSTRDGIFQIYVMNADGSGQTRIGNIAFPNFDPTWSQDSKRIAFASIRNNNMDIYAMNVNGTGEARLTTDPGGDFEPAWSHDGSKIAFVSTRNFPQEVYVMNADGSNQTRLTNDNCCTNSPSWSPDGSVIAYVNGPNPSIHVVYTNGTGEKTLTNDLFADGNPSWSPDGTKIVFDSFRNTGYDIYIMNADGSDQGRINDNPATNIQPSWGIPSTLPQPTVTVIAHIVGGPATLNNVTLFLDGLATTNGTANNVIANQQQNISEQFMPSSLYGQYTTTFSGDCNANGIISAANVTAGANLQCIVTNTAIAPPSIKSLSLHITLANVNNAITSLNMNVTLVDNQLHPLVWQAKDISKLHNGQHVNFSFKSIPSATTGFLVCAMESPNTQNNSCTEYALPSKPSLSIVYSV